MLLHCIKYFVYYLSQERTLSINQNKKSAGAKCFTARLHVRPAEIQISLCIRLIWSESTLSAWIRFGSLANAQTNLSLRCAHMPSCKTWCVVDQTLYLKYSWLSLSRSQRDSLKYFEISVPRHIIFAELRKKDKSNNHSSQMNMYLTPENRDILKILWKKGEIAL